MALVTVDQIVQSNQEAKHHKINTETLKQKKLKRKNFLEKLLNAKVDTTCSKSGIQHEDQIGISDGINSIIKETKELSTAAYYINSN